MSSCQSAFASWGAADQGAFGQADTTSAFDGTYACQQQVMDALAAYQAACGRDQVRTLTSNYSDTQSLQSFCMQKKGVMLSIPADPVQPPPPTTQQPPPVQTSDQPVQPPVQSPVQPPVQSPVQPPVQTGQPVQPSQPGQPVDTAVQVNPGQPSQGGQRQTLQPSNAVGGQSSAGAAVRTAGAASSVTGANGFRFTGSAASPTSAVPVAGGGSVADNGSNSTGLYAGIGVAAAVAVLGVAAFVVRQQRRRRKEDAIDRLRQIPNSYSERERQPYGMHGYTASTPASAPPMLNVPSVAGGVRTSGSQYSSGKTPFNAPSSGAGDDRSSTLHVFAAVPPLDEKSSMMNAAYAPRSTPTISSSRQRDSLLSDGFNAQRVNTAASYPVSAYRSSPSLPPVPTTSDPNQWTVAEVEAWARSLPHFGNKLGDVMLEYQINGRVLMGLDRDAMKDELGLVFGEVSQLEADIAQLRGGLVGVRDEEGLPPDYDDA
ncbi:hypothetical protein HDU81_010804 [Chytriomyces hyalinus]|nr:hypothetical protein HDU81_010804 [Chytriomyces hyalinus]